MLRHYNFVFIFLFQPSLNGSERRGGKWLYSGLLETGHKIQVNHNCTVQPNGEAGGGPADSSTAGYTVW